MRSIENYDIIIVGGGPAGAMAALCSKGNVLLVEKKEQIGIPVHCGEGIYGKIVDYFDLGDCVKDAHVLNDVQFYFNYSHKNQYSKRITIHSNDIYIINKDLLLQRLIQEAKEKKNLNLTVMTGTIATMNGEFIVLDDKKTITPVYGKVIIDASGMSSTIGKYAGISTSLHREDIHVCTQYTIDTSHCYEKPLDPTTIKLYMGEPYAPTGYLWVFPKGKYLANVGLGVLAGMYNGNDLLNHFIEEHYKGANIQRSFTAPLCLAPPNDIYQDGNVLLTGDAARLCIPLSGAGIGNAMLSGQFAGVIATEYNMGEWPLTYYQEVMTHYFKKLWKAYRYKQKLSNGKNLERLLKIAKPMLGLHSVFPRTTEHFALRNFRF